MPSFDPFSVTSGDFMSKAWRKKSCSKQFQHFKALKCPCDTFNGEEKPFVLTWGAVLGLFSVGSLYCHNPGVRLTHSWWAASESSSSASLLPWLWTHCCAASLQRERRSRVHSCWDVPALRCRGFSVWSRLNGVAFLWGLDKWSTPPHSYPILSTVRVFVRECYCRELRAELQRVSGTAWHTSWSH